MKKPDKKKETTMNMKLSDAGVGIPQGAEGFVGLPSPRGFIGAASQVAKNLRAVKPDKKRFVITASRIRQVRQEQPKQEKESK